MTCPAGWVRFWSQCQRSVTVAILASAPCPDCKGRGTLPSALYAPERCPTCNGDGADPEAPRIDVAPAPNYRDPVPPC